MGRHDPHDLSEAIEEYKTRNIPESIIDRKRTEEREKEFRKLIDKLEQKGVRPQELMLVITARSRRLNMMRAMEHMTKEAQKELEEEIEEDERSLGIRWDPNKQGFIDVDCINSLKQYQ
jgi:thermostable 8-oxoguanine DNA glycosylase